MIDTHCHLTDQRFDEDRERVLDRAHHAGVTHFIEIAYAPEILPHALAFAAAHPSVFLCPGVHGMMIGQVYLDGLAYCPI
jgi:TatD DNase family protein